MQGERVDRFPESRGRSLRHMLERLAQATDTYAADAADKVEGILDSGEAALKAARA